MLATIQSYTPNLMSWWYGKATDEQILLTTDDEEKYDTASDADKTLTDGERSPLFSDGDSTPSFLSPSPVYSEKMPLLSGSTMESYKSVNESMSKSQNSCKMQSQAILESMKVDEHVRQIILNDLSPVILQNETPPKEASSSDLLLSKDHLLAGDRLSSYGSITPNCDVMNGSTLDGVGRAPICRSAPARTFSDPTGPSFKRTKFSRLYHIDENSDSDVPPRSSSYTQARPRPTVTGFFPFKFFSPPRRMSKRKRRRKALSLVDGSVIFQKVNCKCSRTALCKQFSKSVNYPIQADGAENIVPDGVDCSTCPVCSRTDQDTASDTNVEMTLPRRRQSYSVSESSMNSSLDNSWSEYTVSLPTTDMGDECHESDLASMSAMSELEDVSTKPKTKIRSVARKPNRLLAGVEVDDNFVDNECFCCHCIVM